MTQLKELKQPYQGDFTSQPGYASSKWAEAPTLDSAHPHHQDDYPATPKVCAIIVI